jgi:hypothetical protein
MTINTLDTARRVLATSARIDGRILRLTAGQLSRPDYVAVNKVLESLGGKWNRKEAGHVFTADPTAALQEFLNGSALPKPARTAEGYIPTPASLAAEIVANHTDIAELPDDAAVLEPSAGYGPFVDAALAVNPHVQVTAVEPNADRLTRITSAAHTVHSTFEQFAESTAEKFDAIVMNPPFSTIGRPTIWIDHVHLAYSLLAPGGRLTAIVPVGLLQRQDRKHTQIRELMHQAGGHALLSEDAFKACGTAVRTAVMWLHATH